MVMDEAGRNGWNWHLAQQITQLVIKPHIMQLSITVFQQQTTQPHAHSIHNNNYHTDMSWGDFYFSYKYQKFSPIRYSNNLQFGNK